MLLGPLIAGGAACASFGHFSIWGLRSSLVVVCLFGGLAVISLGSWIVRKVRHPEFTILPGTPVERIGVALIVFQLGFGVAALILLAAWLAALLLWPETAMALIDAFIMTIIFSLLSGFTLRSVLNLAVAIQPRTERVDA